MNDYLYSQRYGAYANEKFRDPKYGLNMANAGCVITCCAMLISYFNDKALYPDQFLIWLKAHNGLTSDGRLYWNKVCEATANKLRFSYKNDVRPGETTYTLRQVYFGRLNHWVMDSPTKIGMIIDPWDGQVKYYSFYRYTGQHRYFHGCV